jgi:hypothetical protein
MPGTQHNAAAIRQGGSPRVPVTDHPSDRAPVLLISFLAFLGKVTRGGRGE